MITAAACHAAWRRLPLGTLNDIIGDSTCLVLAPHPDDESLGCGGLIAACVQAGRPPWVAILTDGAASHPNSRSYGPGRLRQVRKREVIEAVTLLGLPTEHLLFLDQPDSAAPTSGPGFDAAVKALTRLFTAKSECATILAPWRHDPHCDHEAASILADAVARAASVRHVAYPVWGWTLAPSVPVTTPIMAGWRLDVRASLPAKRAAIRCHASQMGQVITDDPDGFALPAALLEVFEQPFETYLLA